MIPLIRNGIGIGNGNPFYKRNLFHLSLSHQLNGLYLNQLLLIYFNSIQKKNPFRLIISCTQISCTGTTSFSLTTSYVLQVCELIRYFFFPISNDLQGHPPKNNFGHSSPLMSSLSSSK